MAPRQITLKKPAGVMKRPAGHGMAAKPSLTKAGKRDDAPVELTEAALANFQDSTDSKIEEFLNKLSTKQQQLLWKRYESKRKEEGTDNAYKEGTSGVGAVRTKNDSLKLFIKSGGTTKNPIWRSCVAQMTNKEEFEKKEKWLTLNEARHKWGDKELKQRVTARTVTCKPDEDDARFPVFQEVTKIHTELQSRSKTT